MARLQTIGDRIRYLLEQKGITQADWAKAAGLGTAHLNRIIKGHHDQVTPSTLKRIAVALECDASWLRTGLEATGVPVKHEPSVPEPSIVHGGVSPGDLVVATIGTVPYLVVIHKRL